MNESTQMHEWVMVHKPANEDGRRQSRRARTVSAVPSHLPYIRDMCHIWMQDMSHIWLTYETHIPCIRDRTDAFVIRVWHMSRIRGMWVSYVSRMWHMSRARMWRIQGLIHLVYRVWFMTHMWHTSCIHMCHMSRIQGMWVSYVTHMWLMSCIQGM